MIFEIYFSTNYKPLQGRPADHAPETRFQLRETDLPGVRASAEIIEEIPSFRVGARNKREFPRGLTNYL